MVVIPPFRFTALMTVFTAFLIAAPMQGAPVAQHQADLASKGDQERQILWKSDDAKYLIGLAELRPKTEGALTITPTELRFDNKGQHSTLALNTIVAVGVGNERVERWGMPARIVRMAIYDGGGLAVAAVLNHVVDLLTVEYQGQQGEYHGVVFVLPKNEATVALTQLGKLIQTPEASTPQSTEPCAVGSAKLKSITVNPISTQLGPGEVPIPPEYKVLLYEHVVQNLKGNHSLNNVYRFDIANRSKVCSEYSAEITVKGFKKGNNAVRASTGPIGLFVGTTVLAYELRIKSADGQVVLEKNIKSVVRGENESLDIAAKIAKTIAKAFAEVQKSRSAQPPIKI